VRRLLLALLPGLALAGCGGLPTPPAADAPPEFEFRLGPGDRVRASLWGEQQLDREVEVGPDGVVSLPLIGDVPHAESAFAETDAELLEIDRSAWRYLRGAKPWLAQRLAEAVVRSYARRVREVLARSRDQL